MKRSFSESDSDEGEFFERNEKDFDGVENESPKSSARKRRRGQIEKKRRDRINSSLAELRQLVPAALKKQGSTKLEKAEILQLTVEHLRCLKYSNECSGGLAMTRAIDERITGHQECVADGKLCLSTAVGTSETAHLSPMSPARRQIVNHLNWHASLKSGHNETSPLTTALPASTKTTNQEFSTSGQAFTALSSNATETRKGCVATRGHKIQDWGLSVALNCPTMLPFQTPALTNVLQSPFGQTLPFIDWSMALITKTNFSTPCPSHWAP